MNPTGQYAKTPQAATGILALLGGLSWGGGSGARRAPAITRNQNTGNSVRMALGDHFYLNKIQIAATFAVITTVALLLCFTGSSFAEREHIFSKSFAGACTGAGGACEPGQLSSPQGIAVSEATGDVYVVDKSENRVEVFSPEGKYEFEFSGSGSGSGSGLNELFPAPTGQFSEPESVAVDNTCALKEQQTKKPLSGEECEALDPSNGDVYVGDIGHGVIDKFSATGAYIGQLTETTGGAKFGEISGVAVGATGSLWVTQVEEQLTESFAEFSDAIDNEYIASHKATHLQLNTGVNKIEEKSFSLTTSGELGLAANSDDIFYFKNFSGIYRFNSSGALINNSGEVENNEGDLNFDSLYPVGFNSNEVPSGIAVDLLDNEVYIDDADNEGSIGQFSSSDALLSKFGYEHLSKGGAMAVNAATGAVYVVDPGTDTVDSFILEPLGIPAVESESASSVTSTSAALDAELNPKGLSTEYDFEYGPTMAYGQSAPIPNATLAGDFDEHQVSVPVQGLAPHTTYYYRVVAHNALSGAAPTYGEDQKSFVTQTAGGALTLPDGRQWELVTPPDKHGALFYPITGKEGVIQASASGDAIVDVASQPTEAEPQGYSNNVSVLSTRGSGGWASQVIAPPHGEGTGPDPFTKSEYSFFSEDLSHAIVQPVGAFTPCRSAEGAAQPCLSPEASEQTAFLRTDYLNGDPSEHCSLSCYQPLVTGATGFANVPSGTTFGGECYGSVCGTKFVGASPDLSHVVLSSRVQLTSTPVPLPTELSEGLYEWSAGHLDLVDPAGVLPEGESGGVRLAAGRGIGERLDRHVVSDDGERVMLSSAVEAPVPSHLYVRDLASEETTRLDVFQGVMPGPETEHAFYMTASSDGSRILFLDAERLTADSTASASGEEGIGQRDLYEYNLNAPAGQRLTDLTVDGNPGESASVGWVLGASENGEYVYFVAGGALTSNAAHGVCGGGDSGVNENVHSSASCNLYVRHDGVTELVAALSAEDMEDWEPGQVGRVSPDGRWLTFMSNRDLTGYDTRDTRSGHPDEEVYLYDAEAKRLVCASCNPTGARPVGIEYKEGDQLGRLVDGTLKEDFGLGIAAELPTWTYLTLEQAFHQSRYLSDSGRLFFDSNDALVPQDVNGTQDVYEYEPEGVPAGEHACGASSTSGSEVYEPESTVKVEGRTVEGDAGCVALISSGASPQESAFLDASETGGDVFFLTTSKLAPQDTDTAYDVYDAHECTSASPCIPPPAAQPPGCVTEASCKAAPTPQPSIFGSPASATFSGQGNLAPPAVVKKVTKKTVKCKKGFVKNKRGKCVKKPKKKSKRAKKAGHGGRTKS